MNTDWVRCLSLCFSFAIAASVSMAAETVAESVTACKLFPQITPGITNADGQLVMNCQIAADGLTVTDQAWFSFDVGEGKGKRWNFNQTPYREDPLVDFRFDEKFAGLPLTITVEVFDRSNIWNVTETYQEILQLGGKPQFALPPWFHIPQNRLAYDFDEGTWFPTGWTLPKGKFACWEGGAKFYQTDRDGRHPMLDFGFTQVAENTISGGGHLPGWDKQCRVFGDAEWLEIGDGFNLTKWHNDGWINRGKNMKIVIPDFENGDHLNWTAQHYDAFTAMVTDFKTQCPHCLLGCWGIGVTNASLRIFDQIDENGRPTGVVDLVAAKQWRDKYKHPEKEINQIFDRTGLNFGNPSIYWINSGNPAHLYAVVQEWEVGKLARPEVPNVMSTWIQTEFVDGYPLSPYQFTKPDGSTQIRGMKHQAPPSFTYAMSLFSHCRMDGAYCWETGTMYSEDVADAGELGEGGMQTTTQTTHNGMTKLLTYYLQYFGFYNYHVLGMWQASQNKDIIEADTQWFMPEFRSLVAKQWRSGDECFPSYCNLNKEPLIRAKWNADKTELLVIACNPYNQGVEQVQLRAEGHKFLGEFELIGDYPVIQRYRIGKE